MKDHVALKIGGMAANRNKFSLKKYIKLENSFKFQ